MLIKVSLGNGITGIVERMQIADTPSMIKLQSKFLKESESIKVKVLSVNSLDKILLLTIKPTLRKAKHHILLNYSDI